MNYSERKIHAQNLVDQDRYPDALNEYSLLFKENPYDQDVLSKVLFLFSRIIDGNYDFEPSTAEEFVMRGVSRFYAKEFELSIEDYDKAISLDSGYDYAYKSKAFSLRYLGRFDECITNIKKAIDIYPAGEYFDDLAEVYDLIGDTNKAFQYYQKAIAASPDSCRLWYNFGVHSMEKGDYKDALLKFDKAIELFPLYEDAIVNKRFIHENFSHKL